MRCRGQQRRRVLHHFGDGILAGSSTLKSIRFRHSAVTENSSSLERAVTGSHGQSRGQSLDSAKMGSPMNRLLRQGIKREFLAQRVSRYLVGHVHSHVHRYMTYSRPWTVNGHSTATVRHGARCSVGCCSPRRLTAASLSALLSYQDADDATLTRLRVPSSLRVEDLVSQSAPDPA